MDRLFSRGGGPQISATWLSCYPKATVPLASDPSGRQESRVAVNGSVCGGGGLRYIHGECGTRPFAKRKAMSVASCTTQYVQRTLLPDPFCVTVKRSSWYRCSETVSSESDSDESDSTAATTTSGGSTASASSIDQWTWDWDGDDSSRSSARQPVRRIARKPPPIYTTTTTTSSSSSTQQHSSPPAPALATTSHASRPRIIITPPPSPTTSPSESAPDTPDNHPTRHYDATRSIPAYNFLSPPPQRQSSRTPPRPPSPPHAWLIHNPVTSEYEPDPRPCEVKPRQPPPQQQAHPQTTPSHTTSRTFLDDL